ncbi:MAG: c-type cytochrome [Acidobacteriia bacterium]|nr:c-type cytochrome [Terriglobia bacterium]
MTRYRASLILSAFLLTTLLAWSAKQPKEAAALGSELARAPAAARKRPNPHAGHPEAVPAGRNLFERHGAQCHGSDGRGREQAPDLHSSVVQQAAPGTLFWVLKNGNLKAGMPSWSRLPDQQLWQFVSYRRTLDSTWLPGHARSRGTAPVTPLRPPVSVQADHR